ncbi:biotin--[acetyl-CoA-carboxylase] ligase [Bacteroides sp. OttesenSCG-928-D19]|nr:biotin--[acetyl-CoA-carboxylase] ligase [Bacteroides sp. OttesenSCG-928-D19]
MMHFLENLTPYILVEETDSTSSYLQRLCNREKLEEFTTVFTNYQTAGKGQRGNSWESQAGKNLLFSFITYPGFLEIRKQFMLSKIIALSIKESLDKYAGGFTIKWPNDIYHGNKKICGTLIENDLQGSKIQRSIAGVGINVNQEQFLSNAPNPVSLLNITGKAHAILPLLSDVLENTKCYYTLLKEGREEEINALYHQSLYRKEGYHLYEDNDGPFRARVIEVLPQGLLALEDANGRRREYAFKEVRYVI